MTKVYTVEFHDKTMDYRLVRWTTIGPGVYSGDDIERFDREDEAMDAADWMNAGEEWDLYHQCECEFDN
jgi:hypothetical protein